MGKRENVSAQLLQAAAWSHSCDWLCSLLRELLMGRTWCREAKAGRDGGNIPWDSAVPLGRCHCRGDGAALLGRCARVCDSDGCGDVPLPWWQPWIRSCGTVLAFPSFGVHFWTLQL